MPRYQFTARDVKSGALFVSYAKTKDLSNASTFCAYLLAHLKRMEIDVRQIGTQTDNDGAFVGNWRPGSFSYKTPLKIITEELGVIDPQLLALPPIILDDNFHICLNTINNEDLLKEGHHVPRLLTEVEVERYQSMNLSAVYKITDYPAISRYAILFSPCII